MFVVVQMSVMKALIPKDEADEHSAILEVRAGVLSVPLPMQ